MHEREVPQGEAWGEQFRETEFDPALIVTAIEAASEAVGTHEQPAEDERLWHYTSIDAAAKIIESGSMWATDADYLNDTTELRSSARYFHSVIERRLQEEGRAPWAEYAENLCRNTFSNAIRTTYVASFTTLEDDLSQWRAYGGNGRGCAIAFEPELLKQAKSEDQSAQWGLLKCRYPDEAEWTGAIEAVLDAAVAVGKSQSDERLARVAHGLVVQCAIDLLAPMMKSKAYMGEVEVRLFAWTYPRAYLQDSYFPHPGRRARVTPAGFAPYMPVSVGNALSSVMLGPGHQPDAVRQRYGLRSALSHAGYHDVTIDVSRQPYRG